MVPSGGTERFKALHFSFNVVQGLLTIDEVAAWLRLEKGTLYQWRAHRKGPRARKIGRHLRYDAADVRAWLDGQ